MKILKEILLIILIILIILDVLLIVLALILEEYGRTDLPLILLSSSYAINIIIMIILGINIIRTVISFKSK